MEPTRKRKWMQRQSIYILPTGFGVFFVVGAFIMVLIGASYQNNLINMLAFFMLSITFVAMVQTHNNLKDLSLESIEIDDTFAGKDLMVTAVIKNESEVQRFNLESQLRRTKPKLIIDQDLPLAARGSIRLKSTYQTKTRGVFKISGVSLYSVYPLGLFRAWRYLKADKTYFVYPAAQGAIPLPTMQGNSWDAKQVNAVGGDDFRGHRNYQKGDAAGHIDWKAFARGRPLLVKELTDGAGETFYFDWSNLPPSLSIEARLSQMAKWVTEAMQRHAVFAMRMNDLLIPTGEGSQHGRNCLRILASFDSASQSHGASDEKT